MISKGIIIASIFVFIVFVLIIIVIISVAVRDEKNISEIPREHVSFSGKHINEAEMVVAYILSNLPRDRYRVINSVMLQTARGTSEIDHIVVSIFGIFVIETKNYCGRIIGNEEWKEWIREKEGVREMIYSPIRQNYGHVKALEELLNLPEYKFIPIVTFLPGGYLDVENRACNPVISSKQLIEEIESWNEIEFSENELESIEQTILSNNIDSRENRNKHKEYVEEIINKSI